MLIFKKVNFNPNKSKLLTTYSTIYYIHHKYILTRITEWESIKSSLEIMEFCFVRRTACKNVQNIVVS